jgi:hypothetical protein
MKTTFNAHTIRSINAHVYYPHPPPGRRKHEFRDLAKYTGFGLVANSAAESQPRLRQCNTSHIS